MKKKKRKLRQRLSNILIVLVLLVGIGLIVYPSFSNWYNVRHESRVVNNYNNTVQSNDDEVNKTMWQAAREYNASVAANGVHFTLSDEEKAQYNSILDVTGTGVMGYIKIDSLNINLPIYHDTSEGVLQVAVGHLAGTSLPVGGNSSHSVLTGHTGLPSARLFTDIDQLEAGDTFQVVVLDHTLTYEVYDIRTVLPDELDSLQIEPGRDLCTLVTCTPYGINTHRLLVTGYRIPNPPGSTIRKSETDNRMDKIIGISVLMITAVILLVLISIVIKKLKQNHI